MTDYPNIVIIMTDQQQASALPLYGNPVVQMPNLARFSEHAVTFNNAFTSCPLCVPARVSMFTGQYPSAHESVDNSVLMTPGKDHMLKILKEHGYRTGLAGKNHCFRDPDLAFLDVFDSCGHWGPHSDDETYRKPMEYLRACRELKGCWGYTRNPFPPEQLGTHWTTDRAVDFLRGKRTDPFFLWLSVPDPHIPFQTPEPYASMYDPVDVDMPAFRENEMAGKPRAQQIDSAVMCADQVTEETIRNVRAMYYGMNTYIDDELGRFFNAMEELNLFDNTVVVYVSDHGEYLGEHKMIRKSKAAYDCLTHVPLIIRGPGIGSFRTDEFVSLEDIMPTVLQAAGIDIPPATQGRDLTPLLAGDPLPESRPFAYGEYGGTNKPVHDTDGIKTCATPHSPDFSPQLKLGGFGKMRYLRTDAWKLVGYVDDQWELYDLEKDPYELDNLYNEPAYNKVKLDLQQRLIEHGMRTDTPGVSTGNVS